MMIGRWTGGAFLWASRRVAKIRVASVLYLFEMRGLDSTSGVTVLPTGETPVEGDGEMMEMRRGRTKEAWLVAEQDD